MIILAAEASVTDTSSVSISGIAAKGELRRDCSVAIAMKEVAGLAAESADSSRAMVRCSLGSDLAEIVMGDKMPQRREVITILLKCMI